MMERENHHGTSVLWASAFFIAALIFVAAGRHTSVASADNVNTDYGFTVLTTPNGQGTEFLYVIDDNRQILLVYSIPDPQNNKSVQPIASWYLPAMFNSARH